MASYRFPGDVEITAATIVSSRGEVFDIRNMVLEINIYQSLFDHYLQCDIAISDALNLNNSIKGDEDKSIPGGFNGGEVLIISYRERTDASMDSEIPVKKHMFGIYETSDRSRINENTESYIISGISLEAYQTMPQTINKVYGRGPGNTITNMMKSIINEYVYTDVMRDQYRVAKIYKSVEVDDTSGLQKYIIPSLSVDETIDFLANEADSEDHYPYYIFYEDSSGFKFKNVSSLIDNASLDFTYTHFMSNITESNTEDGVKYDDQYKIISYSIVKDNNILKNVSGGLFKSKTINLDILKKKTNAVVFDYEKESDKFTTVGNGKFNVEVNGTPIVNLTTSRTNHDSDVLFQKETPLPKKLNTFFSRKGSYQKQLFNKVIEISIPGNSTINVGGVIDLEFYIHNDIGTDKGQLDKLLSGSYLITKVRQKITDDVFTTLLECSKGNNLL